MHREKKTATELAELVLAELQRNGFDTAHHLTVKKIVRGPAGHNWELDTVTLTEHAQNIRLLTCAAETEMWLQGLYDVVDDA